MISASPDSWYHLYTSALSFLSQEGLFLKASFYSNATGFNGRVFGYAGDNRTGGYAFYTDYLNPTTVEKEMRWALVGTPGYNPLPLETISFAFQSSNTNWTFYLTSLEIYGYERGG